MLIYLVSYINDELELYDDNLCILLSL